MARRVVVEIELPDNTDLEKLLRGVKYRVIRGGLWDNIEEVRRRHLDKLGGPSSLEEYRRLEEELWLEE